MHYDKKRKKWYGQAYDGTGVKRTGRFDRKEDLTEWMGALRIERQRARKGMRAKPLVEISLVDGVKTWLQHREKNAILTTFDPEPSRMKWWIEQLGDRTIATYDNSGEILQALDRLSEEGRPAVYRGGVPEELKGVVEPMIRAGVLYKDIAQKLNDQKLRRADGKAFNSEVVRNYARLFGVQRRPSATKPRVARAKKRLEIRRASPATRNRYRALLSTFFQYAILNSWTQINPVSAVPTQVEVMVRPSGSWKDPRHLEAYLKAAAEEGLMWLGLMTFYGLTGARCGEGQGLLWMDVEWDEDQFMIRRIIERKTNRLVLRTKGMRAKNKKGKSDDPKPMFPIVRATLRAWQEQTAFKRPEDHVFADPQTGSHLRYGRIAKAHHKFVKAAKAPRITLHGLRHTFQQLAEKSGFARGETQHLLGHATISTTERYASKDVGHLVRRAEALGFGALPVVTVSEEEKERGNK